MSLPAKILKIMGQKALVSLGDNQYKADISLLEKVVEGDYILLHAGFGIQKISDKHAKETLEIIKEMQNI